MGRNGYRNVSSDKLYALLKHLRKETGRARSEGVYSRMDTLMDAAILSKRMGGSESIRMLERTLREFAETA